MSIESESPASFGPLDLRRELCDQNVFVFHLPADWTEQELTQEFEKYGPILSCKVVKRPDGSSKGYGFVCYDSNKSAIDSVQGMNGHPVAGKRLKVSLKKTPEECLSIQVQKLMELAEGNQPFDRDDCTLFVFHLPSHWDDAELFSQFQAFGQLVSVKVVKKDDLTSRGYGFVTYEAPRYAALAITNMNGVDVGSNKRLKVQLKQQSTYHIPIPGSTIFVFHLPNDWDDDQLRQHFSHYGRIVSSTVQRDSKGQSRGYGFIGFEQPQLALNAIAGMNGFAIGNKRLKVSLKKGEENRGSTSPGMFLGCRQYPPDFNLGQPNIYDPNTYTSQQMPGFPGPQSYGYPTPGSFFGYGQWSPPMTGLTTPTTLSRASQLQMMANQRNERLW